MVFNLGEYKNCRNQERFFRSRGRSCQHIPSKQKNRPRGMYNQENRRKICPVRHRVVHGYRTPRHIQSLLLHSGQGNRPLQRKTIRRTLSRARHTFHGQAGQVVVHCLLQCECPSRLKKRGTDPGPQRQCLYHQSCRNDSCPA